MGDYYKIKEKQSLLVIKSIYFSENFSNAGHKRNGNESEFYLQI